MLTSWQPSKVTCCTSVTYLVQHLLGHGPHGDQAAGAGGLRDEDLPVRGNLRDREAHVVETLHNTNTAATNIYFFPTSTSSQSVWLPPVHCAPHSIR